MDLLKKIYRILKYVIEAYDYSREEGLFESRMTETGPQLGVMIFISHEQASFIRKTKGEIRLPQVPDLPYANPLGATDDPLPSQRAGISSDSLLKANEFISKIGRTQ